MLKRLYNHFLPAEQHFVEQEKPGFDWGRRQYRQQFGRLGLFRLRRCPK
jgi:hypothetical protein